MGVVQGNMGLMQKRENPAEGLRRHIRLTRELRDKGIDFVVWSDSPLSMSAVCEQTWIDGRRYFDRARDAEAYEVALAERALLLEQAWAARQRKPSGAWRWRPTFRSRSTSTTPATSRPAPGATSGADNRTR